MIARLTSETFGAVAEQTTIVTGANAAEHISRHLAAQLQQLAQQRADIKAEIQAVVGAHPLTEVLAPMPGIGIRTTARILAEVVGKGFTSAAYLVAYAVSHPSHADLGPPFVAKPHPGVATKASTVSCFYTLLLRSKLTQHPGPTKRRNAPKENVTTMPSPPSPDADLRCSSPCSETALYESHPAQHASAA